MGAYLTDHPPVRDQWYDRRTRQLTGCTELHSAENIMDEMGGDTGAESVAEFIRTRTTAGSYHDLVDSDTGINLVEYDHGAYHDATGSNNWALALSFACRTVDWKRMSPARRGGFMWQGAFKFVQQQLWRERKGYPLTRLVKLSRAESDAGKSGVIYHGDRDPVRRTDPGSTPADPFPLEEFFDACRRCLAQFMPHHPDAAPAARPVINMIDAAYNRVLAGLNGATWDFFLGRPLGPEAKTWDGLGRWRQYAKGAIYWHPQVRGGHASVMWGAILARFWALRSERGVGYPITDELACPDAVGRYQEFQGLDKWGAAIYWNPRYGAKLIKGRVREAWAKEGWEQPRGLGYPLDEEHPAEGGLVQNFERGSILWLGGVATVRRR